MVLIVNSSKIVLDKLLVEGVGTARETLLCIAISIAIASACSGSFTTVFLLRLLSNFLQLCLSLRFCDRRSLLQVETTLEVQFLTPRALPANGSDATFTTMHARYRGLA